MYSSLRNLEMDNILFTLKNIKKGHISDWRLVARHHQEGNRPNVLLEDEPFRHSGRRLVLRRFRRPIRSPIPAARSRLHGRVRQAESGRRQRDCSLPADGRHDSAFRYGDRLLFAKSGWLKLTRWRTDLPKLFSSQNLTSGCGAVEKITFGLSVESQGLCFGRWLYRNSD